MHELKTFCFVYLFLINILFKINAVHLKCFCLMNHMCFFFIFNLLILVKVLEVGLSSKIP